MNDQKDCPRCGKELPADAPGGICPSCLAAAYMQTGTVPSGRVEALPVGEVAPHFPDLEILGLLGSGGMGAVYKVRQLKLDRMVALKVLNRDERDPRFVERFTREAKTLARLNHPNIVAVYEFGERDGLFFLIMELVDGVTLRSLLREGRMKPEQALAIVPSICEALQYAHEKGVIHRDIKPENILIDKEGLVKVADFGIARLAGLDREQHLTGEAEVVGTAHYMAPEQVERPASVDHRADIYALGVVFYEMLTGELPLGRFAHPSKKVQIDVRLDEVVLKALEKEPEQRYQQASEVRTRVETICRTQLHGGKPVEQGPSVVGERLKLPAIGLMVAAVLNLVPPMLILVQVLRADRESPAALSMLVWLCAVAVMVLGAAAMVKLRSYGWSIAAAVTAIIVPPGLLVGLPMGIWTLVLLSQKEVRKSFQARAGGASSAELRRAKRVAWASAAALAVLLVAIASVAIPAWERDPQGAAQSASVRPVSSEYGVTFPNGVSFEVAAICRNPRNSNLWWAPDGTPLPEGTVQILSGLDRNGGILKWFGLKSEETGDQRFGMPATPANTPENEVLVYVRRVYPADWPQDLYSQQMEWMWKPLEDRQGPHIRWRGGETAFSDLLWFREVPDRLDLKVTVPLGPWEPVAVFDGAETRTLVPDVKVAFRPAGPGDHKDLALEIAHDVDFKKHELRLVARFRDGSTRQLFIHSTERRSGDDLTSYVSFSGNYSFRLADVKEFELARTELTTGEIKGIRLAPRTSDGAAENAARAGVAAGVSWGPLMERVVNDDVEGNDFFVDLDTGELSSPPASLNPNNREDFLQWVESEGLDAMGQNSDSVRGLAGMGMKVRPIASGRWGTISTAEVEADSALREAAPGTHTFMSATGDLLETFLFETREGGRGVLQITGFSDDPRGVNLRWKLVRAGTADDQARNAPSAALGRLPEVLAQMEAWTITEDRFQF